MGAPAAGADTSARRPHRRNWSVALICALASGACARAPRWTVPASVRAPDTSVAAALDDFGHGTVRTAGFDMPELPALQHLRPCCAFGEDLSVSVGTLPVLGLSVGNIRGLDEMGHHRYDAGLVPLDSNLTPLEAGLIPIGAGLTPLEAGLIPLEASLTPLAGSFFPLDAIEDRGMIDRENNGLVYTCRAGFLDTAHVRENADWTMFLTATVEHRLETGGTVRLPDQGGTRRILLRAVDPSRLEHYEPRALAVNLAAWIAFQISVWHEIAQWYGFASLPGWSERVSAFSLEDLYSNLFGIKLARGIVLNRTGTEDERAYNSAMDAWIAQALVRVEVVSKESAQRAIRSVDGIWWDSSKRLPDWTLVRRRYWNVGPDLAPWVVSMAYAPAEGPYRDCAGREDLLVLHSPAGLDDIAFADIATLEIEVGDSMLRAGFPLPRPPSSTVTQADFPWIIDHVRREGKAALGDNADRPARDADVKSTE